MDVQEGTLAYLLQNVWQQNSEKEILQQPVTWIALSQFILEQARESEEQNIEEYEKLDKLMLRVMKAWFKNFQRWQISSFNDLITKTGTLLAASYRTSLSTETMKNAVDWSCYYIMQDQITEEVCSGLLPMLTTTTSTSCTTAAIVTEVVDAPGEAKSSPSFREVLNKLSEKDGSLPSSALQTGSMCSYITACESGESPRKYGITEKIKDYRLHLSLYDGKKCKENPAGS